MHSAVLIIGSLLWRDADGRAKWRTERLNVKAQLPVQAPFYYGRKSQSGTFTMTFENGEASSRGVLVPCTEEILTIDDLVKEAKALWKVEAPKSNNGAVCSDWGCVGALFRSDAPTQKLAADWTAHFQKAKAQAISVVNKNGLLDIGWPNTLDGKPVDFDVILATATKPDEKPPLAQVVADAWADQCGHEDYFFNNVRHGIRTPDDGDIWRRIEERSPCWLKKKGREYQEAIKILRSENANTSQP